MKILVFGSCNVDHVFHVPYATRPGESLLATKLELFPGGKGLNQAVAVAKAGAPVFFAGCVGAEDTMLRPVLEEAGVDTTYLKIVEERTGQAIIQLDEKGQNSIVAYKGANSMVTKEQIDETLAAFAAGDILLFQNETNNIEYLLERAADRGMITILNPSPFEDVLRGLDLNKLSCIILNETEAMLWGGFSAPEDFLEWAGGNHPSLDVVLTLGSQGSIRIKEGQRIRQKAYPVEAVDTTGAGDTFTGYLVDGLSRGMEMSEILKRASAASAIAVSRMGAAPSIPAGKEVTDWLEKNRNILEED